MKIKHYMYIPWTGLGLYQGFRGNRWLRNRIIVFKQFVLPSLLNQTNKNFTVWCSWRKEEKKNKYVKEFIQFLEETPLKVVHTFEGVCFWDDKYPDKEAKERLITSLHYSIRELLDDVGDVDQVYMTIQPSDDCYRKDAVEGIQNVFNGNDRLQAVGFKKGYLMNYRTGSVAEWNPETNPPFFTIKMPKKIFIDTLAHYKYIGPYKSHEYIGDHLEYGQVDERAFLVGTHFDNISTVFNHPYRGEYVDKEILKEFGIENAGNLIVPFSLGRYIFDRLPYQVKRKLRYWSGEKKWILRPMFRIIYNILRA